MIDMKMGSILRHRLRGSRGFTLVEMVVACLATGILMAGMLGLYYGVGRTFADSNSRMVNQDDARSAINTAARYIRAAQSSASNLTSATDAIALANPQEFIFYADVDGDGVSEKVRYYMSGTSLMMSTTEADTTQHPPTYPSNPTMNSLVIMTGIQNGSSSPIFTYYQLDPDYLTNPIPGNDTLVTISNPTSSSDLAKVAAVKITLYVNEGPKYAAGAVKLDCLIQIRQRYNGGLSG